MIRFIDLRDQNIHAGFAFFNTVTDRFEIWHGSQVWDDWSDFTHDVSKEDLERRRALCSAWVFERNSV